MVTKVKLIRNPLLEELEKEVNNFLSTEIGKFTLDEDSERKTVERVLKDIQYVKDISTSAVMIVYEETRL